MLATRKWVSDLVRGDLLGLQWAQRNLRDALAAAKKEREELLEALKEVQADVDDLRESLLSGHIHASDFVEAIPQEELADNVEWVPHHQGGFSPVEKAPRDLTGCVARCSGGQLGVVTGRKVLPWGLSWVGVAFERGAPMWASRNPDVLASSVKAWSDYLEETQR